MHKMISNLCSIHLKSGKRAFPFAIPMNSETKTITIRTTSTRVATNPNLTYEFEVNFRTLRL